MSSPDIVRSPENEDPLVRLREFELEDAAQVNALAAGPEREDAKRLYVADLFAHLEIEERQLGESLGWHDRATFLNALYAYGLVEAAARENVPTVRVMQLSAKGWATYLETQIMAACKSSDMPTDIYELMLKLHEGTASLTDPRAVLKAVKRHRRPTQLSHDLA